MRTARFEDTPASAIALAAAALVFGCQKPTVDLSDASLDGGDGGAFEHDYRALVPKSATLPGNFSPPKDPVVPQQEPAPPPPWFGFEPFPGATLLCSEQVAATKGSKVREVHWATYGVTSSAYEVSAFYKRRDAGVLELDRDETTFVLGKTHRLSVVRLPTTQPYPRCERSPAKDQRAVIVLSRTDANK